MYASSPVSSMLLASCAKWEYPILRDHLILPPSTTIFFSVSISMSLFLLHISWACWEGCFAEHTQHSELSTTKLRASSSRGLSGRSEEQQFVDIGVKGCPLHGAEEGVHSNY
jgi:hypothetical protein